MQRSTRCVVLSASTEELLAKLLARAAADVNIAEKLGLCEPSKNSSRALTRTEIRSIAAYIGHPQLSTEGGLVKILCTIDPVLANNASMMMVTCRRQNARLNTSRLIEALIVQGAKRIETDSEVHAGQTCN